MTLDDVMRVVIGFTVAYDDMPPTEKDVRAAVEQCIAEQVAAAKIEWLKEINASKKNYSDIVSDGGLDPRDRARGEGK